ncbi:flagellar hook-basal body protein [Paenibacillus sp. 1001270B_150601_E10]|uniref:flagellar hook-basal body protein n=1 Tax=Paenibacillus sp. 1001270B_150601_E10 TaxID=2787079 RepID=UPI00189DB4E4|nr:flagellar hook-basal body protein [Paenibacillus sp. 1001270B_150601_E10]
MLRGLYTAASGMMTQQRRHDTVTNNIANMNTTGYKSVNSVQRAFPEMMIKLMGNDEASGSTVGKLHTGVFGEEARMIFAQGDLMQTNMMSDFALVSDIQVPGVTFDASGKSVDEQGNITYKPEAFFTVRAGDETRYTRDGHFQLNVNSQLITADGALVLGTNNQPIVIPDDLAMSDIYVDGQGRLNSRITGQPLGQALLISRIDNPNDLLKTGNGQFRLDEGAAQPAAALAQDARVEQGYLERSNVDPTQSMVELNMAFRAYEANQRVIQYYDKTLEKTVNEIGRV